MNITYPIQFFTMSVCNYAQLKCTPLKKPTLKKKLILVDCSNENFNEPAFCPTTKAVMMERIHSVDAVGQWIKRCRSF
jgi:hypothetical protein